MAYNKTLMQNILDFITEHPEEHDQITFESTAEDTSYLLDIPEEECHTTRCIAGWAFIMSYPFSTGLSGAAQSHYAGDSDMSDPDDYRTGAAELLGLSEDEALELFYEASNEEAIEALKRYINS